LLFYPNRRPLERKPLMNRTRARWIAGAASLVCALNLFVTTSPASAAPSVDRAAQAERARAHAGERIVLQTMKATRAHTGTAPRSKSVQNTLTCYFWYRSPWSYDEQIWSEAGIECDAPVPGLGLTSSYYQDGYYYAQNLGGPVAPNTHALYHTLGDQLWGCAGTHHYWVNWYWSIWWPEGYYPSPNYGMFYTDTRVLNDCG
jgi:hypothetical protein